MAALNPLYDPSTDNAPISSEVQNLLNQPLKTNGMSQEDQDFLNLILAKIENKSIRLYEPSSLLNNSVYEALGEMEKGKADQNAVVLLTRIREIYNLTQLSKDPSYQLENMVASLRLIKNRFEEGSDVFII